MKQRNPFSVYMHWLHTRWPAGTVEKLPLARPDGSTNVPGLSIVGDLTGIPLLKFSADTGAKALFSMLKDPAFVKRDRSDDQVLDVAIVGGGVSGFSAAIEAHKAGLSFKLFEASEAFSTIVNFPKAKPIYTYPTDMTPAGDLQFHEKSSIKEGLLEDLHEQVRAAGIEPTFAKVGSVKRRGGLLELDMGKDQEAVRAHRVVVAIGRSGNFRKLNIPGEDLDKVSNRLHDPKAFCGKKVVVVGGGDSALEAAIAMAACGTHVTLSYRKSEFSRPKPDNIDQINALTNHEQAQGSLTLMMASKPKAIAPDHMVITDAHGRDQTLPNDAVFALIGREAPLDFFRKSGVTISGEMTRKAWLAMAAFIVFMVWVYHWKSNKPLPFMKTTPAWLNSDLSGLWQGIASWGPWWQAQVDNPATLLGTLAISAAGGAFFYSLLYSIIVVVFGIRRVRRRKTPYVKWQTTVLTSVQVLPLFLLPEIILPLLGHHGLFDGGALNTVANGLFPEVSYGHGREYWRAYGFILAWPLMVWNLFTTEPLWWWIVIGSLQTFVIIPLLVWRYGKGAYCGWICSCGALAETLGDTHRHKMPHGPFWNRLNMLGQVFLLFAMVLLALRIVGWVLPAGTSADLMIEDVYAHLLRGQDVTGYNAQTGQYEMHKAAGWFGVLKYEWLVDVLWAGIIGYGVYFWFSGRAWCRFACPLAALMHLYARFSQFRILADKNKCISCNVCTSVCHQGIDIMNFANKGRPMEDPQCVRCSACVQSCPTGVLTFGRVGRKTGQVLGVDLLAASPVQMAEVQLTVHGH